MAIVYVESSDWRRHKAPEVQENTSELITWAGTDYFIYGRFRDVEDFITFASSSGAVRRRHMTSAYRLQVLDWHRLNTIVMYIM